MLTLRPTTPAEREAEHARRLALLAETTLATCTLPTGQHVALVRNPVGYHLEGDLRLFGVAMFDTLPILAVDDDDAVRQAESLIRSRWAAVLGDG